MRTRIEIEKAAHVLGDDRWNVWMTVRRSQPGGRYSEPTPANRTARTAAQYGRLRELIAVTVNGVAVPFYRLTRRMDRVVFSP
jgi:hypothetical protein